jgi:hypothetical protein
MFRSWRQRRHARLESVTFCEADGQVCTAECRAEAVREHARDQAFLYLGPGLR